jgi:hypothetical protein
MFEGMEEGLEAPGAPPVVGDGIPEKLVKYVPAETLAFFVPFSAAIGPERTGLLIAVLVVSAITTVGYLWWQGQSLPREQQPLPHYYVLAVIAFACWAFATAPSVTALLGADALVAALVLAGGVALIPMTDQFLTWLIRKNQ